MIESQPNSVIIEGSKSITREESNMLGVTDMSIVTPQTSHTITTATIVTSLVNLSSANETRIESESVILTPTLSARSKEEGSSTPFRTTRSGTIDIYLSDDEDEDEDENNQNRKNIHQCDTKRNNSESLLLMNKASSNINRGDLLSCPSSSSKTGRARTTLTSIDDGDADTDRDIDCYRHLQTVTVQQAFADSVRCIISPISPIPYSPIFQEFFHSLLHTFRCDLVSISQRTTFLYFLPQKSSYLFSSKILFCLVFFRECDFY